jgi:hypothetical protein
MWRTALLVSHSTISFGQSAMRDIAALFETSDSGLAKACRNAAILFQLAAIGQEEGGTQRCALCAVVPRAGAACAYFNESIESVRVDKRTSAVRISSGFDLALPNTQ